MSLFLGDCVASKLLSDVGGCSVRLSVIVWLVGIVMAGI